MDMVGATALVDVTVTQLLTLLLEEHTVVLLAMRPLSLPHLPIRLAAISPQIVPIVSPQLLLRESTVSGALLELEISANISILVLVFLEILVL